MYDCNYLILISWTDKHNPKWRNQVNIKQKDGIVKSQKTSPQAFHHAICEFIPIQTLCGFLWRIPRPRPQSAHSSSCLRRLNFIWGWQWAGRMRLFSSSQQCLDGQWAIVPPQIPSSPQHSPMWSLSLRGKWISIPPPLSPSMSQACGVVATS